MSFTSLSDHKLPDGSIDWKAYKAAQRANGEICTRCESHILFGSGHPDTCYSCKTMRESDEEVHHDSSIRCPKCRHTMSVMDGEHYDLYAEGDHDVACESCNHDFVVTTSVSYSFASPELESEADDVVA